SSGMEHIGLILRENEQASTLRMALYALCAPLRRSISYQKHDTLKVIGMALGANPVGVEFAFADQTGIILDVEVERKRDRDYRNGAHGLPHLGTSFMIRKRQSGTDSYATPVPSDS
ncbi:hypothetical protein, partial [Paracoccus sp. PAMC 22219]|uniref:hypothetical protein n=1 Tax=Paracoccus sp. PAMC 22219 TaxID=1569209 RepID=UPI001E620B5B